MCVTRDASGPIADPYPIPSPSGSRSSTHRTLVRMAHKHPDDALQHQADGDGDDHPHDSHPDERRAHSGVRGVIASVIGHSHDPGDSIDEALTSDARGIRAVKLSLLGLGATAVLQLAVVLI